MLAPSIMKSPKYLNGAGSVHQQNSPFFGRFQSESTLNATSSTSYIICKCQIYKYITRKTISKKRKLVKIEYHISICRSLLMGKINVLDLCFLFWQKKNRKLFQSDSDLRYDSWTGPNPVSQLRFVHMPCVFEFMGYLAPPLKLMFKRDIQQTLTQPLSFGLNIVFSRAFGC